MVTIVKHEWHQVDRQYAYEMDEDILSEIYPDHDEDAIKNMLAGLAVGSISIEDVLDEAQENDVDIDWDFQYEDCWTDRKGSYEVTYELGDEDSWQTESTDEEDEEDEEDNTEDTVDAQWPFPIDQPNELTPNAKWPFENAIEVDDEEEFLEDLSVLQEPIKADPEETLPNYPAGEYTIRVWGRTREIGVDKITKTQYEYWNDEEHASDLADALNENYDYDENKTPKRAQFDSPYYEYQGVDSIWGFDSDDTSMTIEDSEGNEIYNGDLESFIKEAHGDNDSLWDASEEIGECYPDSSYGKGYFVFWTQGGKGSCIQTTIDTEGEEFDPRKLKIHTRDICGQSLTCRLLYDEVELDDEGMDDDNWRGQWSDFSVHKNE